MLLGVTGGIAAYKTIQLARDLTRLGARVQVVMTEGARRFLEPLSFEGVTGLPVLREVFTVEAGIALHVDLGRKADVVCVAPATADLLARAAMGRADDLLTATLLVTRAPVLLCPAMNDRMFAHPQVQENLRQLEGALGYHIVGPAEGPLAAGEGDGPGRMLEPHQIREHVGRALGGGLPFAGRKVVVTAGPTREPLDSVRYLGNRSSGRMGYALAAAAWRRGADVVLVSGPTLLDVPTGVEIAKVETAREMRDQVARRLPEADIAVFAAAVADYRPSTPRPTKVKRAETGDRWELSLVVNPDIAAETRSLRKDGMVAVGFALETEDLVKNARGKLEAKGFDLIVANDVDKEGSGFEVETNQVELLFADGRHESLPLLLKDDVAEQVLDRVAGLLEPDSR